MLAKSNLNHTRIYQICVTQIRLLCLVVVRFSSFLQLVGTSGAARGYLLIVINEERTAEEYMVHKGSNRGRGKKEYFTKN